jgi:hypothetical protein
LAVDRDRDRFQCPTTFAVNKPITANGHGHRSACNGLGKRQTVSANG